MREHAAATCASGLPRSAQTNLADAPGPAFTLFQVIAPPLSARPQGSPRASLALAPGRRREPARTVQRAVSK